MGGVFGGRLGGGLAFFGRRDDEGIVIPAGVPRAGVADFTVALLPELRFFACADERKGGAGNYGNVGAAHDFEEAEGPVDFLGEPLIAGDDVGAEDAYA